MPVCCASDLEAARWNFESARRNGVDCCPLCGEMRMGCAAAAAAAAATQAPQPAAMHGAILTARAAMYDRCIYDKQINRQPIAYYT